MRSLLLLACAVSLGSTCSWSQPYDILTFDPTAPAPWSDVDKTTLQVPLVPKGSINLDANPTPAEYGGFAGITVTPGENAWILDYPPDRVWDGPEDSSFTFWLAHDEDYLYVGVDVKDDVVNTDDPNSAFWKDDSIEIIIDALNDRFDVNTDSSNDAYGGHCYMNFEGRFSRWDDATGTINGQTWSSAVDWKYGPDGDIFGVGAQVPTGWKLEARFKKTLFEDPAAGNKLQNGYVMGFNIGLDDDDQQGPGLNGNASRTQDLEIQYFWANRERHQGMNPTTWAELTPEQQQDEEYLTMLFPLIIDSTGRLTHGGAGQIVFAAAPSGDPVDRGQVVNGFQDDFTSETRNPNWKPIGPGGDLYRQANGLLSVTVRANDPNHLLYDDVADYNSTVQEVLARMRITAFGVNADGPRAGIAVGVADTNSQGINLHFRNFTQDNVSGRQFKLLDDARAWGPPGLKLDWQTNVWYWLRLRQEKDAGGGTNDVFGKVWLADGQTPEPSTWQLTWNYIPTRTERSGLAGITGSSIDGVGNFEVDYILIKADGLPSITVDFPVLGPPPTTPVFTSITRPAANQVRLEWIGAAELEATTDLVAGPWTRVPTAASPYVTPPTGAQWFYRLKY